MVRVDRSTEGRLYADGTPLPPDKRKKVLEKKRVRAQDTRDYEKKNGPVPKGKDLDHGGNFSKAPKLRDASSNRSEGGKNGDKKGKSLGGKRS